MPLATTECSLVVCDRCGDVLGEGGDYVVHFEHLTQEHGPEWAQLLDWLSECSWAIIGNEYRCPDCWEYDDDFNMVGIAPPTRGRQRARHQVSAGPSAGADGGEARA